MSTYNVHGLDEGMMTFVVTPRRGEAFGLDASKPNESSSTPSDHDLFVEFPFKSSQ